jgi:hypothetical protein
MKMMQLSPTQWASIQDNPIQRDTERHALRAVRRHLRSGSETHKSVSAAMLPDGTLVKLDGHTRSLLWQDGRLPSPDFVWCTVYEVPSMEEAAELYKHFDNAGATENAGDRLSGAYRLHDISPKSQLLINGGVSSAFGIINGHTPDIYSWVGEFRCELGALDQLEIPLPKMSSPMLAAALLTVKRRKERALHFWAAYVNEHGTRIERESCGVLELLRLVQQWRDRKIFGIGGAEMRLAQAGKTLSCCEAWLNGRTFVNAAKVTDFRAYVALTLAKGGGK